MDDSDDWIWKVYDHNHSWIDSDDYIPHELDVIISNPNDHYLQEMIDCHQKINNLMTEYKIIKLFEIFQFSRTCNKSRSSIQYYVGLQRKKIARFNNIEMSILFKLTYG